jgi:hypothetical protein
MAYIVQMDRSFCSAGKGNGGHPWGTRRNGERLAAQMPSSFMASPKLFSDAAWSPASCSALPLA